MIDVPDEIGQIEREVRDGRVPAGEGKTVAIRRTYPAPMEDVWDAITDPSRISRWFMPVSGDFRLGGKYQLEGNAGGEILRCEPPRLLKVSWIFGDAEPGSSEVEVRLSTAGDDKTVFELEHTAVVDPEFWGRFGPGAVGVGWDGGLLGLGLHLRGATLSTEEREAWPTTPEAKQFYISSSQAWGAAHLAAGASQAEVATAVENATRFYTGEETA